MKSASSTAALGLARSLIVYYGQPWRTIPLRRFYRELLTPGSLVFDLGAHVGHRSVAMAAAGARVIAVEPQPLFADFMARFVARSNTGADITLCRSAIGAQPGQAELHVSHRHPTVSTISRAWMDRVGDTAGFEHVDWNQAISVEMTTLDALIAAYGEPAFCKIDVEGAEAEILAGLSRPLACVAFECLPEAHAVALDCVDRLSALGAYRFNWVIGERHRWASDNWVDTDACRRQIDALTADARGGDIYARRCAA